MFSLKRRNYNVEALLRPVVEFYPAIAAFCLAFIALLLPGAIMMTQDVAYAASAVLALMGFVRLRQGLQIRRYQKQLLRLPDYRMSPEDIKVGRQHLFLGKGFRWSQKHTQRLTDVRDSKFEEYTTPSWIYRAARKYEKFCDNIIFERFKLVSKTLAFTVAITRSQAWWNPASPLPPVGGRPEIHAVGMLEGEEDVLLDLGDRVGHTLVVGTTRVGKTRQAEILITQDILRGDFVVILDPKGDADLLRRARNEAARAGRPFIMFHLGYPEISARYNGIGSFTKVTEGAGRLTEPMPSDGSSAAFKEFGWRFSNIIIQACVGLGMRPTYELVRKSILSIDKLLIKYSEKVLKDKGPENWREELYAEQDAIVERDLNFALKGRNHRSIAILRYVRKIGLYDPVLEGLLSAFEYDKTYFDKIVSSLGPLLEKLTTGKVSELISPDYSDLTDSREIFDWLSAIRSNAVVYIGLDALSDSTVAGAVGTTMFADLTSLSGYIYKHGLAYNLPVINGKSMRAGSVKISVHADEFNELIGDQFIPLLNKAGGSGFQITAYTQTISDILAKLGDRAKTGQVLGNFNTIIMMRVKEPETAELIVKQLEKVKVVDVMQVSGATDSSVPGSDVHFTSKAEDRQSKVAADILGVHDLTNLPKGQAFVLKDGAQLWKVRMPLLEASSDERYDQTFEQIYAEMDKKYRFGDGILSQGNQWLNMMDGLELFVTEQKAA